MAVLLDALVINLQQFAAQGFSGFAPRWNALHAHAGQEVVLLEQGQVIQQGRALGVDAIGRLLLDTPTGRIDIMAGDISLRSQVEA